MYYTSSYVDWYLFHEDVLNYYWDTERTRSTYDRWTDIWVEVVTLHLGDGGWELCQYIRFRTRFEPKLCPWLWESVVKYCMRHTFVGSVITMWSYNQNIMRLSYPNTKPIFTAWLTDLGSTLYLIWAVTWFPTMWRFDTCRLKRACAVSF